MVGFAVFSDGWCCQPFDLYCKIHVHCTSHYLGLSCVLVLYYKARSTFQMYMHVTWTSLTDVCISWQGLTTLNDSYNVTIFTWHFDIQFALFYGPGLGFLK